MIDNMNIIHEGVIKDIVDILTDNDFVKRSKILNTKQTYFNSVSKATSNLVLTFPVLVDETVSLSTARMISKAVEHKMVTMLQMLFSAIDINNNKDAFNFIGKVHKNLTSDDIISFINKMDSIPLKKVNESTAELDIDAINDYMVKCLQEDTVCLKTGIKESLNDLYSINASGEVIQEAAPRPRPKGTQYDPHAITWDDYKTSEFYDKNKSESENFKSYKIFKQEKSRMNNIPKHSRNSFNDTKALKDLKKDEIEAKEKSNSYSNDNKPNLYNVNKDLHSMTVSSDVKKVNEEVPSLMIINFRTGDDKDSIRSTVIGVKAKVVYVGQEDIIERIVTKNNDNNGLFNFLRATTGEISMLKDFVFAINKAKLDAINTRPNSSPIWKMLERRYLMNKKNWLMSSYNGSGSAIAVLVVSRETVDRLERDFGFKCIPSKLLDVMEAYSIMGFIITDDVKEKVLSLFDDNSTNFETLSYSAYEREDKSQYKKLINLITGNKEN